MSAVATREVLRRALKRALDVAIAGLALMLLAPLLLLIALLVVLDSPGPVFYRATRFGFRGRPLQMLKFRKMRVGAAGAGVTLAQDERLTRVGAWLARTKLDELPQLWHVLRGEMSLVGPRPESPDCVCRYAPDYALILSVRPGITGYTQLAFAREGAILDPLDPERHYLISLLPQKVALDRLYATQPSIRRDLRILWATIMTLGFGQPVAVDRRTGDLTWRHRHDSGRRRRAATARQREGRTWQDLTGSPRSRSASRQASRSYSSPWKQATRAFVSRTMTRARRSALRDWPTAPGLSRIGSSAGSRTSPVLECGSTLPSRVTAIGRWVWPTMSTRAGGVSPASWSRQALAWRIVTTYSCGSAIEP
jgi:lipopolysaccharide/colanic/teichoic acid biosynthesis glycosyltransferase